MTEDEESRVIFGLVIGLFMGCIVSYFVFVKVGYQPQQASVNHGCAHYDTNTGKFQWNKKETNNE